MDKKLNSNHFGNMNGVAKLVLNQAKLNPVFSGALVGLTRSYCGIPNIPYKSLRENRTPRLPADLRAVERKGKQFKKEKREKVASFYDQDKDDKDKDTSDEKEKKIIEEEKKKRDPDTKPPIKEPDQHEKKEKTKSADEEDVREHAARKAAPKIDLDSARRPELASKAKDKIIVVGKNDVSLTSEIPEQHIKERYVRVFKPAKNAMQSGTDNIKVWKIEFEARERWENPLMGWTSSGDPLSYTEIDFKTKEDAVAFVEKHGWPYYVDEPVKATGAKKKFRPSYADTFSWNRRTRTSSK